MNGSTPTSRRSRSPVNEFAPAERDPKLSAQYGGNSRTGWVGYLPSSWVPYIQLARLGHPANLFLIYFPHLFGVLHGAVTRQVPINETAYTAGATFVGSFFVSNAVHIWNDIIDAPLDAKVERTKHRPIPRASQTIGALLLLPYISSDHHPKNPFIYSLPSIVGWTYYPWAKRHTNYPQAVLGFCFVWAIAIGSLAVGVEPVAFGPFGHFSHSTQSLALDYSAACLFTACILWTMIYDTIYAHQDLKDDLKAGIKSIAVLYQDWTKSLLWGLLFSMLTLLTACGALRGMGLVYYTLAVGGSVAALGLMIAKVELRSSESGWWWFGNGFWFAGGAVTGGLMAEYARLLWT
ncbi:hypothetical protein CC78DRAFT_550626 [Lojkania enalia]|uniref:UbiA prenyltransferase n=1 Tax=Lojkania enalia TaxID=147567 RepID=A0A9P4NAT5_9PLEO|nr:hypothetical protein CC78DRAFT_550626 [Didymosphaeria enalia]